MFIKSVLLSSISLVGTLRTSPFLEFYLPRYLSIPLRNRTFTRTRLRVHTYWTGHRTKGFRRSRLETGATELDPGRPLESRRS